MNKRFQVFVSSTYADLKEERQKVIQALMELDCIPAGMELFPAADEEQLDFIKRIIDDCDYYLLIIGARYGSLTTQGISYTEQEYEYALTKGLKVIALLLENPDEVSFSKSEQNPELRDLLKKFRDRVGTGRLVRFWKSADQLPGIVALSLSKTIKMFPAIGWVRADRTSSEDLLVEINELRKINSQLIFSIEEAKKSQPAPILNLAGLDESIEINGEYSTIRGLKGSWEKSATWGDMFGFIGPYLLQHPSDFSVNRTLADALFKLTKLSGSSPYINEQTFHTISTQFRALGLVKLSYLKTTNGGMGVFWSATPVGERKTFELRAVRVSAQQE